MPTTKEILPSTSADEFSQSTSRLNSSPQDLEEFLITHVNGIGPSFAKRLLDKFGNNLANIIETDPQQLLTISGLGKQKYSAIIQQWKQHKVLRELIEFLQQVGMGGFYANRIYKLYGKSSLEIITQNPYRLATEVNGIQFEWADRLANKLDFARDSQLRIVAGFYHLLQQATLNGHTAYVSKHLLVAAAQVLQLEQKLLQQALKAAVEQEYFIEDVIAEQSCIFLPALWEKEKYIGDNIAERVNIKIAEKKTNIAKEIASLEQSHAITLDDEQKHALQQALSNNLFIITGGPGVGKTTILSCLLKMLKKRFLNFAVCAPTGRAAKRITEATGVEAKTVHRLLEYDAFSREFNFDEEHPLPVKVLIIDEASMLDLHLFASILQALPVNTQLILVGDVDQLPSIGPGQVLQALINSNKIPSVKLTNIYRQAKCSQIIANAHRVNNKLLPQINNQPDNDFFVIRCNSVSKQLDRVIEVAANRLPTKYGLDPKNDIQVLSPQNKGPLGVVELNKKLQAALNPEKTQFIKHKSTEFRLHDKVMQIVNNYEKDVYNGDIGVISGISFNPKRILVNFDGRVLQYTPSEWEQLKLGYAITVHKSQGSEYKAVVICLSAQHKYMLQKKLLYTAMTRGKSLVVIITDNSALNYAISRDDSGKRLGKLQEWLT